MGKFSDVQLECCDADLLENLKDAAAISVRRQASFNSHGNAKTQATYRENVVLQFRDNCRMPQRVPLWCTLLRNTSAVCNGHIGANVTNALLEIGAVPSDARCVLPRTTTKSACISHRDPK